MDPQAQTQQQTQKQQITDGVRQAHNIIVTVSQKPDIDQVSAAVALSQILTKLNKRVDAVVTSAVPASLSFLQTNVLHKTFTGIRDFVISVDTAKTEADKLKYVPEGGKLNIYITPFNGNFSNNDVSFSYGDYHAELVIALGASKLEEIDSSITSQTKLIEKVKIVSIHNKAVTAPGSNILEWSEQSASSICEMLMSLTEALQGGLVDAEIATSLLTGIIAKTDHFTNDNTTPKIMTMAAQLMAAGARRADIIKNLKEQLSDQAAASLGNHPLSGVDKTASLAAASSNENNASAPESAQASLSSQDGQDKPLSPDIHQASQSAQNPAVGSKPAVASSPQLTVSQPPNIPSQAVAPTQASSLEPRQTWLNNNQTQQQTQAPANQSVQPKPEPTPGTASPQVIKSSPLPAAVNEASQKDQEEILAKADQQANETEKASAIEEARKAVAEAAKSAGAIEQALESNVQDSLNKPANSQSPGVNQDSSAKSAN
jgi:nanoRNase/pAp phosphatase (c-di-AMP/oligoRNAs hydrolase)